MILIFRPFGVVTSAAFFACMLGYLAAFAWHKDFHSFAVVYAAIALLAAWVALRTFVRTAITMWRTLVG